MQGLGVLDAQHGLRPAGRAPGPCGGVLGVSLCFCVSSVSLFLSQNLNEALRSL